jgi:hypothetical protein
MKLDLIALGALAWLGMVAPAAAQDVASAEALFRRGLDAMEAGRYPEACAAIAESQRLDPRLGTLFTLAECRSKEGKIATAVALYDDYLSTFAALSPAEQARQRGREKIATDKKRELMPHIPRLVLRLPSGIHATVTRDDVTLRPAALGIPLPVDPGEHQITTQRDSDPVHRQTITIGLDEEKVVELEVAPSGANPPPLAATPPVPHPEEPRRPAQSDNSRRIGAWVVGGLGAASLVVGVGTGAVVLTKRSVVSANCAGGVCNTQGLEAVESARPLATASTASFVIGGIGLGTALVLFLTDRRVPAPVQAGIRAIVAGAPHGGAWLGARREW